MLVGVISMPASWRRLILPDVPWLMPSWFMLRQASMMDWHFSTRSVDDIGIPPTSPRVAIGCPYSRNTVVREQQLIIAPQYSRTFRAPWEPAPMGRNGREELMAKAVLGIIGGSGIYD